jgi:type VI secretion system secreted protein VgrG
MTNHENLARSAIMPSLADRFLFEVEGLSQTLRVTQFSGHEGLSELFRFDVQLYCEDGAIAFDDVVGRPACLTIADAANPRFVHGIVARFEQGEMGKKLTPYHITLVPRAHHLELRSDQRIFQELTAPEIVKKVLEGAGLTAGDDFRISLQRAYVKRTYCVQYAETDWAFVSRLLEEEGIFYFFEHEAAKHVLVLADTPAAYAPIAGDATVPFRPEEGALRGGEDVNHFRYAEGMRSGKVTLRDYNFEKPSLLLEGEAAADRYGDLEVYGYPGDFDAAAAGSSTAKVRLEERQAMRRLGEGGGSCARLVPGFTFSLSEHAREAFNRKWLVLGVSHEGVEAHAFGADDQPPRYDNRFRVVPSDVAFRPPCVTPKPSVRGVQSAIVVGPAGEEIHTDAYGRVKVQFLWDRLGKKDDKSSCWMRVSQLWAGEAWGGMHIPRVGQEVLVDFLDGDPDRPIVVGRVYHGANLPPYALPAEKTKSTIKSSSTPGGGGSNELRFEDKKGSEEVFLHAQKDLTIGVENDKNQTVGHDETLSVTNDRSISVGHDQSTTVAHDASLTVSNDRTASVGNDEKASVGHDQLLSVGNDKTESVGNNLALSVAKVLDLAVGEAASAAFGKGLAVSVGQGQDVEVSGDVNLAIGGSRTTEIKLEDTLKVESKITITCGETKIVVEKNGNVTVEGATLAIKATADVRIEASGKVEVKATGDVKVESSGKVDVKGSGPMSLDASGPVKVKGTNVGIN